MSEFPRLRLSSPTIGYGDSPVSMYYDSDLYRRKPAKTKHAAMCTAQLQKGHAFETSSSSQLFIRGRSVYRLAIGTTSVLWIG